MLFTPSVLTRGFECDCGAVLFLGVVTEGVGLSIDPLQTSEWEVDHENANFVWLNCASCARQYRVKKSVTLIEEQIPE